VGNKMYIKLTIGYRTASADGTLVPRSPLHMATEKLYHAVPSSRLRLNREAHLHEKYLYAVAVFSLERNPGYIYEYLRKEYPGVVSGFMNGASGNQSSRHFRTGQTFDEAKRVGYSLAETAVEVVKKMDWNAAPVIALYKEFVAPPMRNIPSLEQALDDQKKAHDDLAAAYAEGKPYTFCRTLECTTFGADRMVTIARAGQSALDGYAVFSPFEVFLLKIGSACLVTAPGEYFVEFALEIKKNAPVPMTFFASVSNGAAAGYLCTREAHEEGGYEALGSMYPPEAGELIVETAIGLLNKAF